MTETHFNSAQIEYKSRQQRHAHQTYNEKKVDRFFPLLLINENIYLFIRKTREMMLKMP